MAEQMKQEAAGKTIPAGYKQTEVGVIPEDWNVSTVGNEYEIKLGKMLDAGKNRGVPKLFLGNKAVQWGYIDITDLSTVPMSRSDIRAFRLCYGDLLVCEGGEVGRAAIWSAPISECYYQKALHRLRPLRGFNSVVMAELLRYWTDSGVLRNYVTQTSIAHLPREKFMEVPMPIPPEKEQTAIANVLSDSDALIDALEQLIAKKQAIKSATMQQLLTGRTRLPTFALRPDGTPKGYKPSELGEIPEDWEVETIGNVCDLLTGYPFPSNKYSDSGIRLLRGSNVKRGVTDWSPDITQYWPLLSQEIKQYELLVGDVVISMDGSLVGRSFAQLTEDDLPAVLLQRVARIRSVQVSQYFLKEWICSPFFTEHCDSVKTVTAIPHISPQDIRDFKLLLPPTMQEQTAIATILSDMDNELQALNQKLEKARALKQGMMQQLLTGKIRLPLAAGA